MKTFVCSFRAACIAAFLLIAGHAQAQTTSPCTAQAETNVTRGGGLAELVADFVLTCLNPASNMFGTEAVLLIESGPGVSYTSGLQDAVILLNEAAPEQQKRAPLDPINPDPTANVFVSEPGGFGPGSLVFGRIPIVADAEGRFTTRITNVRIDLSNPPTALTLVTAPGQSVRVPVLFKGSNEGGAPFSDPDPISLTEVAAEPFSFTAATAEAPQAGAVAQGSGAALTVTIAELFESAAKKRIETAGGPEPEGEPAPQNVPGMNYYTESGFVPADQDLASVDAIGVADSGTRFSVRFQTSSAEITFGAPECVPAQGALGMELRLVSGFAADFSGGTLASSCGMTNIALENGAAQLVYEVVGDSGVHGGGSLESYAIPFGAVCTPRAALSQESGAEQTFGGTMLVEAGPAPVAVTGAALSSGKAQAGGVPYPSFSPQLVQRGVNLNAVCAAGAKPAFTSDGFTDAAAFGKPPAGGALASLFGDFGASLATAETIPLPTELGNVSVTFENVAAAAASGRIAQAAPMAAPLLFVSPGQINLQIPWEVDISAGLVRAVVTVDGVASDPVELPVAALSPGIFTVEAGPGHAIAINPDSSLAQPDGSIPGFATRPVRIGEALIILATGLGVTTPPAVTADDSYDEMGTFVRRDSDEVPRVTIGGVEQSLAFSGMSPQFVGVNQINIVVQPGTPTGDAQPLLIETGGLSSRSDVTIAVAN
ncbi:MAG: hypothetical protein WD733_23155 [Bryobacterales bacterium]